MNFEARASTLNTYKKNVWNSYLNCYTPSDIVEKYINNQGHIRDLPENVIVEISKYESDMSYKLKMPNLLALKIDESCLICNMLELRYNDENNCDEMTSNIKFKKVESVIYHLDKPSRWKNSYLAVSYSARYCLAVNRDTNEFNLFVNRNINFSAGKDQSSMGYKNSSQIGVHP